MFSALFELWILGDCDRYEKSAYCVYSAEQATTETYSELECNSYSYFYLQKYN